MHTNLAQYDPELFQAMEGEKKRQLEKLELIASENIVSERVMVAMGSVLTNKYAEGYPGKRYYGGCEWVDQVETLAINRAKKLFGATYANVQPHSGAQANMGAYFSLLAPGDKILGMNLSHGGHLTHGSPVNFSGTLYQVVSYGVREDNQRLDYDEVRKIAQRERPKLIVAGASAYPRTIDFKIFREIADEIGAFLFTDMAHIAGLVAAGLHPNPVEHSHITTTTTHKTLRGPRGGLILANEALGKTINSKIFPGLQGGPLCHIIAAKAIGFLENLEPTWKTYAAQVIQNAQTLAKAMLDKGYHVTTGGTDNHLMLIDLSNKGLSGKDAELALDLANITVNKNTVPFEKKSPFITSGIRLGSPALTTRGLKAKDFVQVAEFIDQAVLHYQNLGQLKKIAAQVREFSLGFPHFAE